MAGYEHPTRITGRDSAAREIGRLKVALGRAGLRGDSRSAAYLTKRLASARQYALRQGFIALTRNSPS